MATITFDTLQYAKRAEQAGMNQKLAEFHAEEMAKMINDELSTKQDLKDLKLDMKLSLEMMEYRLIIKIGSMMIAAVGMIEVINRFF